MNYQPCSCWYSKDRLPLPREHHRLYGLLWAASTAHVPGPATHRIGDTWGRSLAAGCQKWPPARPQLARGRGVLFVYVEGQSATRTKLAGFFDILLRWEEHTHLPRRCRYGGDLGRTLGFPVQAGHAHHPQRSTPLLSNIPSGRSTPPTNFTICPRYALVKGSGEQFPPSTNQ